MPKVAKELSALEVKRLKEPKKPGHHPVGGVAGLLLQIIASGAASWILRTIVGGKRRDIGLGSCSDVTLAMAREKARAIKELIAQGIDPIEHKKALRANLIASQSTPNFTKSFENAFRKKELEFGSDEHRDIWHRSITKYVLPVIGHLPVDQVDRSHILEVLAPIWKEKTETAKRLRQRIEFILAWAIAQGYRKGDNPARWKNHLEFNLADPGKITKVKHFKALSKNNMPDFMDYLRKQEGIAARALEFAILTAARSGEICGATWDEINIQGRLWIIPEDRMKSGREHRVPLSDSAINILLKIPRLVENNLVFPAPRGGMLSGMSLPGVLKRMGVDAVPHGFRSTFRDWCSEQDIYDREVAEMALAHRIGNATEAAYRRTNHLDKHRKLMQEWDNFLNSHKSTDEDSPIERNENAA